MELSQILNSLSGSESRHEKTASHNEDTSSKSSLDAALSRALDSAGSVKTASHNSGPVDALSRMAIKLASAEQEALVKEAELYGAAACDGFMSRMQDYEGAGVKTAGYYGGQNYEDELLVKQAMDLGYSDTMAAMQKVAEDAYYAGYSDTFDKTAGYYEEDFEKTAAFEKIAAIVKVAADQTQHDGYRIGLKVISNIGRGF